MSRIIIPDDYKSYCTQLDPSLTGLSLGIHAYANTYGYLLNNPEPFVLYRYENAIIPFFYRAELNQNTRPPIVCFRPKFGGPDRPCPEVYRWQKVHRDAILSTQIQMRLSEFISRNEEALLAHWNMETADSMNLLHALVADVWNSKRDQERRDELMILQKRRAALRRLSQ